MDVSAAEKAAYEAGYRDGSASEADEAEQLRQTVKEAIELLRTSSDPIAADAVAMLEMGARW